MAHHGRNTVKPVDEVEAKTGASAAHGSAAKAASPAEGTPSKAINENVSHTQVNRSVTAGAGKHRGDQRDRSPTYTNNEKHAARGNTPRKDVSTRSR